jgi:soluble lytic murein transglycosylase-like protein
VERKSAIPTVTGTIRSHLQQIGRGSNTFCVGVFALGLVNLAAPGPQVSGVLQTSFQPPAAPAAISAAASPAQPVPEAPKPAAGAATQPQAQAQAPAPAAKPETAKTETTKPEARPETLRSETPATNPIPAPAIASPKPSAPPAAPSLNDQAERLRKAADLMVQVNEQLGVPQSPYGQIIYDIAIRHSINPHLVAALIHVESAFNARAVSPKGAYGLMQLLPETARRFGLNKKKDLFDPRKNLEAGVRYLKWLTNRFDGDAQKILAAYNAGEGAVQRFGGIPPYQETQNYVSKIFGLLGFSAAVAPAPQPAAQPAANAQDTMAAAR